MIRPEYLNKGDRIALIAPAGKIAGEIVAAAIQTLEQWGLEVVRGQYLLKGNFQYAATDRERMHDLQQALDDPSIRAILCGRGGYGSIRIIDALNFNKFRHQPKWIIGFSDITVLHAHIHTNFGIETIHGPMASGLAREDEASDSLRSSLFGSLQTYAIQNHPLTRPGKGSGELIGGNLAILTSLLGSASDINTDGKVLFLEEVGEHLYRIDRMMWSLKRAGKLEHISGLVVGGMTDIPDSQETFGKTALQIVAEHAGDYKYPVCYNFPAGHQQDNRALILGRHVALNIDQTTRIDFNINT